MAFEVYEERLVGNDGGLAENRVTGRYAIIVSESGPLRFRLLPGDLVSLQCPEDDRLICKTRMEDLIEAWVWMRKYQGEDSPRLTAQLGDEEREGIAQVVEAACEHLSQSDAVALRAAMLRLIALANPEVVPIAVVDPECFDRPIRYWRKERRASGRSRAYYQMCDYYIDAYQSSRKNVLGKLLPDEEESEIRHRPEKELPEG